MADPDQNREAPADLLTAILPAATERAISAYQYFSSGPLPTEAKEFGSFQTACKAAIGHLTALFQLQRLTAVVSAASKPGGPSPTGDSVKLSEITEKHPTILSSGLPLDATCGNGQGRGDADARKCQKWRRDLTVGDSAPRVRADTTDAPKGCLVSGCRSGGSVAVAQPVRARLWSRAMPEAVSRRV